MNKKGLGKLQKDVLKYGIRHVGYNDFSPTWGTRRVMHSLVNRGLIAVRNNPAINHYPEFKVLT